MEKPTENAIETLSVLLVGLLLLTFYVATVSSGKRWDNVLTDRIDTKPSSTYTLAYLTGDMLVTAAEAYTDIMTEEESVVIQIDGTALNTDWLKKARAQNADGIKWLTNQLHGKYQKILHYNEAGQIVTINYITQH